MTIYCDEYDHAAVVRRERTGTLVWEETPLKVHILASLLGHDGTDAFIAAAYDLSPGCHSDVLHGDLKPTPPPQSPEPDPRQASGGEG